MEYRKITNHPEFDIRVDMTCKQCLADGCNHGVETITSANYFRALHKMGRLPKGVEDRLRISGFSFTVEGEMMSCL